MIKLKVRILVRKMLNVRKHETINSAIDRYNVKLQRFFYRNTFTKKYLVNILKEIGLSRGDIVMVHSSWRYFYNFEGTPEDLIGIIREIIGDEGTILMPSYGPDRTYFDVSNTPSSAGVVSEVFRRYPNVFRSACTHFSISAQGPIAEDLTKDHFNSEYGFDCNSPYYKLAQLGQSKVLFIGLGSKPTKISLFHCAGYMLKDRVPYLSQLLSHKYKSKLIVNGVEYNKEMIIRKPGHGNNNKIFKKILKDIKNKKHAKLSNIDLVIIDAKEGLRVVIEYAERGLFCYK